MTKRWLTKECAEMLSDTMLRFEVESAIEAAVLAEREACAKVCDVEAAFVKSDNDGGYDAAKECAAAIRARSTS